jgi:plastocyanin
MSRRWTMKGARILNLAVVVLVSALAAGCGGGGGNNKTTTSATTSTQATTPAGGGSVTKTVKLKEYQFIPSNVVVKQGGTITAENVGTIAHDLTVEQGPDPTKKTAKLAATPTFLAGKSEKLTVNLKPGKYAMVCTVAGHRQLGMTGTFTVVK